MKRKYEKLLKEWLNSSHKKPLMLRGARQVGKSTLITLFCEAQGLELLEINFENTTLSSLRDPRNFRLDNLLRELELESSLKIGPKTLIFFDEIQNCPTAIEKLRYFYEDSREFTIVAAGSLLELTLEQENISIPVGRVDYLNIEPMDFEEFLLALGETQLLDFLDSFDLKVFPQSFYERLFTHFKEFLYVGGMPEAVETFARTSDFDKVRTVQKSILLTYRQDIPKYSKRSRLAHYISNTLDYTLSHIGHKVKFSDVAKTNSQVVKDAIHILNQAHLIRPCFYTNSSKLPLFSQVDSSTMKLYFLDVGLMNAAMDLSFSTLFKFSGEELMTKGIIVEQFIAQHLRSQRFLNEQQSLYYWLNEKKGASAEIDFILEHLGKIVPIEVKSGATGKMKSLFQFIARKKIDTGVKIDLKFRTKWRDKVSTTVRIGNNNCPLQFKISYMPAFFITKIDKFL